MKLTILMSKLKRDKIKKKAFKRIMYSDISDIYILII